MIAGGGYRNFQEQSDNLDQELFVRHTEIANRSHYIDYIMELVEKVQLQENLSSVI